MCLLSVSRSKKRSCWGAPAGRSSCCSNCGRVREALTSRAAPIPGASCANAKLLGMVIQHWVVLMSCWRFPDRRLVKVAQTVRSYALALAGLVQLQATLETLGRCVAGG